MEEAVYTISSRIHNKNCTATDNLYDINIILKYLTNKISSIFDPHIVANDYNDIVPSP